MRKKKTRKKMKIPENKNKPIKKKRGGGRGGGEQPQSQKKTYIFPFLHLPGFSLVQLAGVLEAQLISNHEPKVVAREVEESKALLVERLVPAYSDIIARLRFFHSAIIVRFHLH